jgi:transcriptional regulator with XRE-family HTH domain
MPARILPHDAKPNFLKKWRDLRNLSQDELAERVGTGKDQISRWENGKRGMTFAVLHALAEARKIAPNDLFRDPDAPSADALLRGASPENWKLAIDMIKVILGQERSGSE